MRHEEHCERSIEMFGEDGAEYHKWMDQYAAKFGYSHRNILHHKQGIMIAARIFGEVCRKHLEQHVKDDLGMNEVPDMKYWDTCDEVFR